MMDRGVTMRTGLTRRELLAGALGAAIERPNVLFLSVDDMNDWVEGFGGHPQTVTPSLKRLAGRGVRFTRAYCQGPMCNPSRASLMTGLRPTTTGVYTNDDVWRDGARGVLTLPEYFIGHGWRATCFGKVYHSKQTDRSSWNAYWEHPERLGPAGRVSGKAAKKEKIAWGDIAGREEDDADPQTASKTIEFLKSRPKEPFFLGCGFTETHIPWYAPKKYRDRFPPASIQLPPYLKDDLNDVPKSALRPKPMENGREIVRGGKWREAAAAYLACINYVDTQIGRVLDALESSPCAKNTLVVFWSDHGWQLGEKDHWQKFTLWERSCRVPLIISVPGARGAECRRTVELLDLYPTLADLCGLPPEAGLEGRSLAPLLDNPQAPWDKLAQTCFAADQLTLRTERWRYTRYPDGEELYDHDQDPNEWTNLAAKPDYAALKRELSAHFPKNPSRRKLKQFNDLTPEEIRAFNGRPRG
jgi:arylsulfatase A-like enzyme